MAKVTEILRCEVGSKAHGLANENSDTDIRGIHIAYTQDFFPIGDDDKPMSSISIPHSIDSDSVSYEIGHFLNLATKSNPSILEVFKAVPHKINLKHAMVANNLLDLFPHVWSSTGVLAAFKGYSHQQGQRMFDAKYQNERRRFKFATTHLRVLLSGIELLRTHDFSIHVQDKYTCIETLPPHSYSSWIDFLIDVKQQGASFGQVVDISEKLKAEITRAHDESEYKASNFDAVQDFINITRREFFDDKTV